MTTFSSSTTLVLLSLLCSGSIAHEHRISSKVLLKQGDVLRNKLPTTVHHCSSSSDTAALLLLRGGSDYYKNDDNDRYSTDSQRYQDDRQQGGSYYDDDRYQDRDYDDRDYGRSSKKRASSSSPGIPNLANIIKNGDRRIGLALLGSGLVFTMLGVSLFFNKSLMRIGNLLFIGGVPMTIGPGRTAGYFFQPKKSRATACLALGIFLVFIGSPVFGIILEVFGLLNLFGNMFPVLAVVMKQMPVVGTLFKGSGKKSSSPKQRDDRYYDDDSNDRYGSGDKYGERYGDDDTDDDDNGGYQGGYGGGNDRYY